AKMREFVKNGAVESEAEKSFSFRVTCNRAGEKSRHNFSSMDAARALGGIINRVLGWRPDMENFDMEVLLNIRNDVTPKHKRKMKKKWKKPPLNHRKQVDVAKVTVAPRPVRLLNTRLACPDGFVVKISTHLRKALDP
ncbi:THUMP domain protein, partial [Teladorsagia circumcincta]